MLLSRACGGTRTTVITTNRFLIKRKLISPPCVSSVLTHRHGIDICINGFITLPRKSNRKRPCVRGRNVYLVRIPSNIGFNDDGRPRVTAVLFIITLGRGRLRTLRSVTFFYSSVRGIVTLDSTGSLQTVRGVLRGDWRRRMGVDTGDGRRPLQ